jgi:hypothetical protein
MFKALVIIILVYVFIISPLADETCKELKAQNDPEYKELCVIEIGQ